MGKNTFVDPEPMLKSVPMTTADEVEIKLNSILYRASWSGGYGFKGEAEAKIEPLRVFFVNNSSRMFRARCILGCEEVFKMGDGCRSEKIYGRLSSAVAELEKKTIYDITRCQKKMSEVGDTLNRVKTERLRVKSMKASDFKMPKEV